MKPKLDRDLASRMTIAPWGYEPRQIAGQLAAALAEIDRMQPVVDAAERWTDSSSMQDEVVIDAVRAYRASKEST